MKYSKKFDWKRVVKISVVVLVIAVLLCGLLTLISPLILFSLEDKIIRNDLNNSYINADYEGWKAETISGIGDVWFPENWEFSRDASMYTVTDENGMVVAYGTVYGVEDEPFTTYAEFMQAVTGSDVVTLDFSEDMNFEIWNPSEFGTMKVEDERSSAEYQYLKMYMGDTELFLLVFLENSGTNYNLVYEIAEAIIYSYYYH